MDRRTNVLPLAFRAEPSTPVPGPSALPSASEAVCVFVVRILVAGMSHNQISLLKKHSGASDIERSSDSQIGQTPLPNARLSQYHSTRTTSSNSQLKSAGYPEYAKAVLFNEINVQ